MESNRFASARKLKQRIVKIGLSLFCLLLLLLGVACKKTASKTPALPISSPTPFFAKGADVSWVSQMESAGTKFYSIAGIEMECMQLLKTKGMNSIRLRVWVNPVNGWNNTADVVAKALRAKNLGMKILLDFHYSDTWADPGQQAKPAAWAALNFADLQTAVHDHTLQVMNALKINGVSPEWVQIGNETNDGLLWPDGKASANMAGYAKFFIAGHDAVKAVSPASKVIVHVSNGYDNGLFRWNLDGLRSNGADWDVTGMSLYPTPANWQALNDQCLSNMTDMISRYNKEVMICEVGMSWDQPAACNAFLTDLLTKVRSLPGNKGLGVFYWEPEAYNNWQGYSLGAFDNTGKPTVALDAFN